MNCRLFLLLMPWVLILETAQGEDPVPAYECQFAVQAPQIDGDGRDEVWKTAAPINDFRMAWLGSTEGKSFSPTEAKVLWDREFIYFWAKVQDNDFKADIRQRDGMTWNDDVIEVFLKPSLQHDGYYEFHVTPANIQMDLFIPARTSGAFEKYREKNEFDFQSSVKLDGTLDLRTDVDRCWEVEFKIAWKGFTPTGGRPEPGETWTFSLCRYDYDNNPKEPTLTSIAPLKRCSFHDYEDFVPIRFVGPTSPITRDPNQAYRFQERHEVSTSKVSGSPEPPLPFTVASAFPDLEIQLPISIRQEPQNDRVWVVTQAESYGPSQVGYFLNSESVGPAKNVLEVAHGIVHYDLCFHPRYPEEPYLFIGSNGSYGEKMQSRISRYRVISMADGNVRLTDEETIIEWPSHGHNGAAMTFGTDGYLYVTSGDGTSDSDTNLRGQDLSELTAKVLRIDIHSRQGELSYAIPADNPFVDRVGVRPETWAYGLRNPWRITTDRKTGRIWVGQNGQDLWEQVYLLKKGANYGWSVMEGKAPFYIQRERGPDPIQPPTADHHHSEARSLTGGIVYHGSNPALQSLRGAYVYGDYSTGKIWALWHDGNQVTKSQEIADTGAAITAFEESPHGDIWVLDHLGKGIMKLVPNREEDRSSAFPRKLSESGLFQDVPNHVLVKGAIPYDVNAPLWSDGAHKERWFVMPTNATGNGKIEFQNENGWTFPNGTVLIKSFALDLQESQSAKRRWIETRFMVREQNEWVGYSYRWNDLGTDAELVSREGMDQEFLVADSSHPSGYRKQTWHYPSRAECMVCHSRAANFTLGLQTAQMNRNYSYDGIEENQLALLERLSFFKVNPRQFAQTNTPANSSAQRDLASETSLLPMPPSQLPRLANPYDPHEELAWRARSYLHSNCSSCHQPAGGGNATLDLRYQVAFEQCGVLSEIPRHQNFDFTNAKIIAPGKPDESVLMRRVATRGSGRMPPLATSVVDQAAVRMLRDWILTLSSSDTTGGE